MQSEDAKYIKKRWKASSVEPHQTEKALIVNYKLEAAVFAEPDNPMLEEKKDCQRIIRLKSLNSKTDCLALAKEVVEKCDLIHASQLQEIEQIIYYLKNRKEPETLHHHHHHSRAVSSSRAGTTSSNKMNTDEIEKATIRNIDEYIELLYEDLPERIRGSAFILQLARSPDNLEELEKNEAVLSALSRVLREDWRKSLDLSTNIIYIFFCFSTYTRFHNVIVQYKIGSLCMEVIEFELKRYDQMKQDLELKKNPDQISSGKEKKGNLEKESIKSMENSIDTIMDEEKPKEMEPPRRRIPELKQRPKSGNWNSFHGSMSTSLIKTQMLNNSYHENLSKELMSPMEPPTNGFEDKGQKTDYEKLSKQLKLFAKKQEQLLRVAFYLLLNIAENVKLEEKMRRKTIVKMLVKTLERHNIDLLILIVTFLKKLSIVKDNKDDMHDANVIEKLPRLLQSSQPDLIQITLKLIFNLSFDGALRAKMIKIGFLPKLVAFLSDDKHHGIATKILYHMSLDDKVKSMFTYTDCVPIVTDMILLNSCSKKSESDLDLIALGVNLALNKRNAQQMIENNRLHSLMSRAFKNQDTLLMKMIRNISQHENLKIFFVDFVGDLARILTECKDEEFMIECLGILGNLSLADLDYSQIMHNFNLIPWVKEILVPGKAKDDLVLEVVILLGTFACDEACAMLLCKTEIIYGLIELLKAKQEDDEIVLQIAFVFQQVLRNESTRGYMIKETESPAYLIDLMHDKNAEIRDEDTDLPNYLTSDYFDHCLIDNLNEDADSNNRSSANSNGRPTSRYGREIDTDADMEYFDSNKMQGSNGDLWKYATPPSDD
uniref:CSON014644 protein n=1 Tax=Culicoides sonorensis TaxID=179676 RepID=A0A336KQW8_CULSO